MFFREWFEEELDELKDRLIHAAQQQLKEFPDPDYGRLFYNHNLRKVHWVAGDGAGGWKQAQTRFQLPGIDKVEVADEYMPSRNERGWERLL